MKHILASDYDGTIRRNGIVTDEDLQAINTFRANHNLFGIVTGRSLGMIVNELKHFKIEYDFIIGNNGGIIVDHNLKVMYRNDIKLDDGIEFINYIISDETILLGISDGDHFGTIQEGKMISIASNFNPLIGISESNYKDILADGMLNSFYLKASDNELSLVLKDIITKKFKNLTFHYNNGTIDVSATGVSKASSLDKLQELLKCEKINVIGDGYNDIEMIKKYKGFSVENAPILVKKEATKIFKDLKSCLDYIINND